MLATVFVPAASAAGTNGGIDLSATIKEPKPEIGITVDVDYIGFGELLPGGTSDSYPVAVSNTGLSPIDVTTTVVDNGTEPIFVPGIMIDNSTWSEYSAQLVNDANDTFGVALHVPEVIHTWGAISGSMTVWAEAISTPVADLSANVTSGAAPLSVQFTDRSANSPTAWSWDFGDGTTSTAQNPAHVYSAPGTYTVSLTASNSAGSDTVTKTGYIAVNESASSAADFTYTSTASAVTITGYSGSDGNVVIPSTINGLPVTTIGDWAFSWSSVTSVVIPSSVTSIGNDAFWDATVLTSVSIGSGVTSIGNSAFYGCTALTSVNMPNSVVSIGQQAFYNDAALTSLAIPAGVTSIGSNAFSGCTALTAINVDAASTAYTSIDGVLYNKAATTLVAFPGGKTSADIPSSVTAIGDYSFYGTALTSLVIPDNVTSIGQYAFEESTTLASVTIGNGVTTIGSQAFYHCSALTSVTLGDHVTTLADGAFYYATALTTVNIPASVTSIGTAAFTGDSALTAINVDPANIMYTSIDGVVYNKNVTALIVCPAGKTSVVIPDSVTSLPANAFAGFHNLATVTIGSGVTAIPDYAFQSDAALTSVTVLGNVASIGTSAFYGCSALTALTFYGNAPTTVANAWALGSNNLVVYFAPTAIGFTTPTWNGVPCQSL